ncbi:hypothetical protein [Saltwater crocodilepox virus]|nr:hypothetical protein [Saltwater crocodilepox virus]
MCDIGAAWRLGYLFLLKKHVGVGRRQVLLHLVEIDPAQFRVPGRQPADLVLDDVEGLAEVVLRDLVVRDALAVAPDEEDDVLQAVQRDQVLVERHRHLVVLVVHLEQARLEVVVQAHVRQALERVHGLRDLLEHQVHVAGRPLHAVQRALRLRHRLVEDAGHVPVRVTQVRLLERRVHDLDDVVGDVALRLRVVDVVQQRAHRHAAVAPAERVLVQRAQRHQLHDVVAGDAALALEQLAQVGAERRVLRPEHVHVQVLVHGVGAHDPAHVDALQHAQPVHELRGVPAPERPERPVAEGAAHPVAERALLALTPVARVGGRQQEAQQVRARRHDLLDVDLLAEAREPLPDLVLGQAGPHEVARVGEAPPDALGDGQAEPHGREHHPEHLLVHLVVQLEGEHPLVLQRLHAGVGDHDLLGGLGGVLRGHHPQEPEEAEEVLARQAQVLRLRLPVRELARRGRVEAAQDLVRQLGQRPAAHEPRQEAHAERQLARRQDVLQHGAVDHVVALVQPEDVAGRVAERRVAEAQVLVVVERDAVPEQRRELGELEAQPLVLDQLQDLRRVARVRVRRQVARARGALDRHHLARESRQRDGVVERQAPHDRVGRQVLLVEHRERVAVHLRALGHRDAVVEDRPELQDGVVGAVLVAHKVPEVQQERLEVHGGQVVDGARGGARRQPQVVLGHQIRQAVHAVELVLRGRQQQLVDAVQGLDVVQDRLAVHALDPPLHLGRARDNDVVPEQRRDDLVLELDVRVLEGRADLEDLVAVHVAAEEAGVLLGAGRPDLHQHAREGREVVEALRAQDRVALARGQDLLAVGDHRPGRHLEREVAARRGVEAADRVVDTDLRVVRFELLLFVDGRRNVLEHGVERVHVRVF